MKQIMFSLCLMEDSILLTFEKFVKDKRIVKCVVKILNNVFPSSRIKFVKAAVINIYKKDNMLKKHIKDGIFIYDVKDDNIIPVKFIIGSEAVNSECLKCNE